METLAGETFCLLQVDDRGWEPISNNLLLQKQHLAESFASSRRPLQRQGTSALQLEHQALLRLVRASDSASESFGSHQWFLTFPCLTQGRKCSVDFHLRGSADGSLQRPIYLSGKFWPVFRGHELPTIRFQIKPGSL